MKILLRFKRLFWASWDVLQAVVTGSLFLVWLVGAGFFASALHLFSAFFDLDYELDSVGLSVGELITR